MKCPCGPDLVRYSEHAKAATCLCCWAKWVPGPEEFYPLYQSHRDATSIRNAGDCPHKAKGA